jgi:hypothetical protein
MTMTTESDFVDFVNKTEELDVVFVTDAAVMFGKYSQALSELTIFAAARGGAVFFAFRFAPDALVMLFGNVWSKSWVYSECAASVQRLNFNGGPLYPSEAALRLPKQATAPAICLSNVDRADMIA